VKFVLAGYGSRGDVEPCAAVARELLRRGHDVRMAAPPNMLGLVESAGLAGVAYGPDTHGRINSAIGDLAGFVQNPVAALPKVLESVTQTWVEKSGTLTPLAQGADLLVVNLNDQELASNVAAYHGIPLAALHVFPARIMPSGPLYTQITEEAGHAQRRALGLPAETGSSATMEIQTYDEICLPGRPSEWVEPDGRRPFVGALTLGLATDADEEALLWIAAGTPPIFFGFGSTPIASPAETVTMISAACLQLGERALICGGSGPNDYTDLPLYEHVKVVDAVNYATVFPVCRAVVHHGGSGTTAAGMRAGVPSLILWSEWDQPVWAAALERLKVGAGRQLVATTRETLVADLGRILTPDYATRAREVAAQMTKSADSVARAADLLEDAARSGRAG
jgi:UDP:flavonoid glycosyltransferase YjiC (YdhE family)